MELNEAQRQAVRGWVAAGASLSEVQKRLKSEFDISLTFMDARLLVLDLGAQVKDKAEPRKPAPPAPAADLDEADDGLPAGEGEALPLDDAPAGPPSKVKVSLDKIVPAGAMVSGNVVFSDGTKVRWILDRMGRLGLEGAPPNFRPSPEDVREFQVQLQSLIANRGY
jgi:hypothetical protein